MARMNRLVQLLCVVFLVCASGGCQQSPPLTATPAPLTATPMPPTDTPIPSTETPVSTATPTDTPLPPTETPIPPTATPVPPTPTLLPATDTVCASGCDFPTVQAAINNAGTVAGAIIEISEPIHTEAGIVVNKDVTIRGLGADDTVVQAHETSGQAHDRVFLIEEGVTAILERMTIRHGHVEDEHGGGILNHGVLTLNHCVVTRNTAGGGGGICNDGDLTVVSSTISNNVTEDNWFQPGSFACGSGGGIRCGRGTVALFNSTVSGNQAGSRSTGTGGGIRIGCNCTAELINSTVSGNRATQYGGGVVVKGLVQMVNCTISDNATAAEGGGVYVGAGGELDYVNTIVADNRGAKGNCVVAAPDEYGAVGTLGTNIHNMVEGGGCDAAYSDDPMLGPLGDNGGETWTHALLPGSPAIDAIPIVSCTLSTDQRWAPRPIARVSRETPCDIGAFELQD
jgi:hypothetical protein